MSATAADAIIATIDAVRTRAHTQETLLVLAVPQEHAGKVAHFITKIGNQVAFAFSEVDQPVTTYGLLAAKLRQSSFFRSADVWQAVGTDREFLDWIPTQTCCVKAPYHVGDVIAAHVRRVADGAGTGLKPPYSAVPLCTHHHDIQHNQGEGAIGGKEFLDQARIETLVKWGWADLKKQLGYAHWSEVPPRVLNTWAMENRVINYLPPEYRL